MSEDCTSPTADEGRARCLSIAKLAIDSRLPRSFILSQMQALPGITFRATDVKCRIARHATGTHRPAYSGVLKSATCVVAELLCMGVAVQLHPM